MPLYSIAEQFKTAHWYYLWSLDARCYHWRHFVYISFFPCLIIHPLFFYLCYLHMNKLTTSLRKAVYIGGIL